MGLTKMRVERRSWLGVATDMDLVSERGQGRILGEEDWIRGCPVATYSSVSKLFGHPSNLSQSYSTPTTGCYTCGRHHQFP